ncbi:NAD-dependent epimerase/dehydratase family protein [Kitasatospora sp. NPDC058965]|uniref:NAD-dependent epimerase/dehydratase family protein n=1 Tax=Kitasatospora sp. NPDC058965 TaxID=3346682 RepID=UPI0036864C3D
MIVVVTGASGFVGGALCRAARAAGHRVLALGRRPAVDPALVGGAPYLSWDLADPSARPAVPAPFARPDAVVHCAGLATDWARPEAFEHGNVLTTRGALAAFPDAARFVHLSTASVYDPRRPTVLAREAEADGVRLPDPYGRSKAQAEAWVRRLRPDAVVLRPHAVYGPGDTTLLPRVLQAVRRTPRGPRLFAVGDGRQLLSLTGVANLVDACLLAAAGDAHGTFNVCDREPVRLDDVLREVLIGHGLPPAPVYLPLAVALPPARAAELLARATGSARRPRLTVYAVRHLAHERTLDLTAARTRLGYRPAPTDLGPALRAS